MRVSWPEGRPLLQLLAVAQLLLMSPSHVVVPTALTAKVRTKTISDKNIAPLHTIYQLLISCCKLILQRDMIISPAVYMTEFY